MPLAIHFLKRIDGNVIQAVGSPLRHKISKYRQRRKSRKQRFLGQKKLISTKRKSQTESEKKGQKAYLMGTPKP